MAVKEVLWPKVKLYEKQLEVLTATLETPETYVTAANKVGKDFVAGFIALACFITCQRLGVTARIVTTSVAEHHLKVLWGEIGRFLSTASRSLVAGKGNAGPLVVNYQEVRVAGEAESKNPLSYLVGRVSAKGEGMAGHHAEFTLLIGDEASGLDDAVYEAAQGWAQHMLFIGNPNPCSNFFFNNVKAGNLVI